MERMVFPTFAGLKCNMMPFVQGDPASLPDELAAYAEIVSQHALEPGQIGHLTIHESMVEAGKSQRGYGNGPRSVHVEVRLFEDGCFWGGGGWGKRGGRVMLRGDTKVLIANSVPGTCRVWDYVEDRRPTPDGDLSAYLDNYPESSGRLLKKGEVARMSIFTPHECVPQRESGPRQFFRIIGVGVLGREDHFTINPKMRGAA